MKLVITSEAPVRLRSEESFKLDSMGLVVRVDNNVKPRCDLYRQYFCDRLGGN
ncbi:AAA-like domain-containing protein [Microcystis aeruginosa CS-555/01A07]|nr:AAA-like domain-containing protein [Microcystis aeruginosa]MDB9428781.1 AAA-like domain-containing protein [Microcystis aeruginosa CS-555/01A07]